MRIKIIIVALLFPILLTSQVVSGKVVNNNQNYLPGASVYWLESNIGVYSDSLGRFEIEKQEGSLNLIASFIGFRADTILIEGQKTMDFVLNQQGAIGEVVVSAQRDGIIISNLNPIKTEQINRTELGKAACCDLAGCFETQSSVQPQTTNIITNSKELRILGLSGVYNQVLINGLPLIQGLSYTYGISSFPGTVVENIFISKGANSVLQGYESISGQINVETRKADQADRLFLNAYVNSFQEKHLNANIAYKTGKWSHLTALHTVQPAVQTDRDNDNFLDLPRLTRYSISQTMEYGNSGEWGWHSKIGFRYLDEQRVGGQVGFDPNEDLGSNVRYGQTVQLRQPEIWTKSGYRMDDAHHFVFYASGFTQNQESYFGPLKYDADQRNIYSNFQHEYTYSGNILKTGVSFRYLNLQEDIAFTDNKLSRTFAGNYERREMIPGAFAENTLRLFDDQLVWIAGARVDHHNDFGTFLTPRTLLRYNVTPRAVIRANIGTGWRTVNLFSENINLLASSRDLIIEEDLLPEQALNYGVNFTQKFDLENLSGYFSTDYYRTEFQNQIFPDYDSDPTKAIVRNFTGESVANGFQADVFLKFFQQFEFKSGYNFLDVFRMQGEEKQLLPFNSRHKVFVAASYKPLTNKFHIDVNAHWYGEQRLPNTKSNPVAYQRPDFSLPFSVVNAQATYKFKTFETYFGCENIFNFRQNQPIISWENPFGKYFDTSSVWGPTRGREFYLGIRYYFREKA